MEQRSAPLPFPTDANPQVDPVRRLAGEVLAVALPIGSGYITGAVIPCDGGLRLR